MAHYSDSYQDTTHRGGLVTDKRLFDLIHNNDWGELRAIINGPYFHIRATTHGVLWNTSEDIRSADAKSAYIKDMCPRSLHHNLQGGGAATSYVKYLGAKRKVHLLGKKQYIMYNRQTIFLKDVKDAIIRL